MNTLHKSFLVAVGCLSVAACSTDYEEIPKDELYLREYVKAFGTEGLGNTWNSATRLHASIDASLLRDASSVKIYTSMPGSGNSIMVANCSSSLQSFDFDAVRGG